MPPVVITDTEPVPAVLLMLPLCKETLPAALTDTLPADRTPLLATVTPAADDVMLTLPDPLLLLKPPSYFKPPFATVMPPAEEVRLTLPVPLELSMPL